MPTTKDYSKLGQTRYVVSFYGGDGFDSFARHESGGEHNTLEEAYLAIQGMPPSDAQHVWTATVQRGTYVDVSFDDDEFGHVKDAAVAYDQDFYAHAWRDPLGQVEFDIEDNQQEEK